MDSETLNQNIRHMKEILKEIYLFTNHLNRINSPNNGTTINFREKKLLTDAIEGLMSQFRIINNSLPELLEEIRFYKKLENQTETVIPPKIIEQKSNLVHLKYSPKESNQNISLVISDKDKKEFLENLGKTNLSINQLKKEFLNQKPMDKFGKPNSYAKISNMIFRELSNKLVEQGYFKNLNLALRKMNSQFVISTYVSMIFMTVLLSFVASIILLITLLFFNISPLFPFITQAKEDAIIRLVRYFWIIFAVPIGTAVLLYFYPFSESKSLGEKMDQELPFVTIHMSSIANSGVEPISIFKIIIKSSEYPFTNLEIRKLLNLINFHGKDLITALKITSYSCPSNKLKDLLDGLATSLSSGGNIHQFLDKHAESLLFDYKLEREKYTKAAETFMDIYISIVIAAPMILLILFVIMGSTGMLSSIFGLTTSMISLLIILGIALLNLGFLTFLRLKQPTF